MEIESLFNVSLDKSRQLIYLEETEKPWLFQKCHLLESRKFYLARMCIENLQEFNFNILFHAKCNIYLLLLNYHYISYIDVTKLMYMHDAIECSTRGSINRTQGLVSLESAFFAFQTSGHARAPESRGLRFLFFDSRGNRWIWSRTSRSIVPREPGASRSALLKLRQGQTEFGFASASRSVLNREDRTSNREESIFFLPRQ